MKEVLVEKYSRVQEEYLMTYFPEKSFLLILYGFGGLSWIFFTCNYELLNLYFDINSA